MVTHARVAAGFSAGAAEESESDIERKARKDETQDGDARAVMEDAPCARADESAVEIDRREDTHGKEEVVAGKAESIAGEDVVTQDEITKCAGATGKEQGFKPALHLVALDNDVLRVESEALYSQVSSEGAIEIESQFADLVKERESALLAACLEGIRGKFRENILPTEYLNIVRKVLAPRRHLDSMRAYP